MILALDPSSTRCGFALLTGLRPDQLLDGGLLRPNPAKLPLIQRVQQFAQDLQELIAEASPSAVVMEASFTRHGHANDRGGASSLGVYGFAVGYLYRVLQASGVPVETVEATVWTGRVPKAKRTARIAALYGARYAGGRDPGGDTADAIGLGRWYLQRALSGGRGSR